MAVAYILMNVQSGKVEKALSAVNHGFKGCDQHTSWRELTILSGL